MASSARLGKINTGGTAGIVSDRRLQACQSVRYLVPFAKKEGSERSANFGCGFFVNPKRRRKP